MAFTAKPASVPEFATGDVVDGVSGQNNVIAPEAAKIASGFSRNEKPYRQTYNWLFRFIYLWINYFNQFFSSTHQLKVDEIIENATGGGILIDGVTIKDGAIELQAVGDTINNATSKTTPVDADYVGLMDSATGNILTKLSWANIKATLKTYFDTLYVALTGNQTIAGIKSFSTSIKSDKIESYTASAGVGIGEVNSAIVRMKVIQIGAWDMDADAYVEIDHGLTYTKIRSCGILIQGDAGGSYTGIYPINFSPSSGVSEGYFSITNTVISINRRAGGVFDSTNFNSTSAPANRGWITIWYVD